jgi:hypothetical protein
MFDKQLSICFGFHFQLFRPLPPQIKKFKKDTVVDMPFFVVEYLPAQITLFKIAFRLCETFRMFFKAITYMRRVKNNA